MSALVPIESDGLPDDRISCSDCAQARDHAGGRLHCSVFRCDMIVGLKRRCVKFVPLRSAADQRTGAQRWPDIQAQIEEVRRMDNAHANRKVMA